MKSYNYYGKKNNIENFEMDRSQFGPTINEQPRFIGQLGLEKTIWTGTVLDIFDNPAKRIVDELKCARKCYNDENGCTKYEYNSHYGICKLFADNSTLSTKVTNDERQYTYAGYIERMDQQTTKPLATTKPFATTKPLATTKPKKKISKLYLFIGLGVFGFIILVLIIMMMTGSKDKKNDDD
jgi:hypothetical protein